MNGSELGRRTRVQTRTRRVSSQNMNGSELGRRTRVQTRTRRVSSPNMNGSELGRRTRVPTGTRRVSSPKVGGIAQLPALFDSVHFPFAHREDLTWPRASPTSPPPH